MVFESIVVACILATGTVSSPLLVAYMVNRRQEALALRTAMVAKDTARLLVQNQAAVAAEAHQVAMSAAIVGQQNLEANQAIAATTLDTRAQLREIHTLVNSNLTAALRAEFEAVNQQLILMREVDKLNAAAGRGITEDDAKARASIQLRIDELRINLDDRVAQTALATKEKAREENK